MLAPVNVTAGKLIARALGATDPNAWVAFATQAQWENGGAVRGNNPLNLTDPGRHLYWRPYGQTGWYDGGTAAEWHTDFAAFASADGGARAAAANYLGQGSYGAVIAACRSGAGPIPLADAIESSPWSSGHYGGGLAARVSAELAALFASTAAAKLPPQEVPPVSEQITTTFSPPRHGTVPDGTRRFAAAEPYAELSPLPADGYLFDALLELDQASPVRRGTFARTTTTPPVLVIARVVSFDPMPDTVVPDAAPQVVLGSPTAPAKVPPSTMASAWQLAVDHLVAAGFAELRTNASGGQYYYIDPSTISSWPADLNREASAAGILGNPAAPTAGADYSGFTGVTGSSDPAGFRYDVWIKGELVHSELGTATTDTAALGEAWGISYLGGGQ